MKESVKYAVTAVVSIVVIVALSLFVRSGNDRFAQTLETLNDTLTTANVQSGQVQQQPTSQLTPQVDIHLNPGNTQPVVTNPPVVNTTVPVVTPTAPVVNNPIPSTDAPVANPSSDPATQQGGAPVAAGNNAETLAYLNNAVNTMRKTQNFTATKDQDINISLTDCSLPAFTSVINGVINGMTGSESYTFTFANGTATDPEEKKPVSAMTAIPPTDKEFTLMADGIASLTSTSDGVNTVYTIVLKPESTTLASPEPYYHGSVMDCFDLTSLDLPIEVTAADFNYEGATIDITVDGQGRVVKYHENMPLNGVGGGKMGFMSAQATIEGYLDETWTITY